MELRILLVEHFPPFAYERGEKIVEVWAIPRIQEGFDLFLFYRLRNMVAGAVTVTVAVIQPGE